MRTRPVAVAITGERPMLSAAMTLLAVTLCLAAEGAPTPPARPRLFLETSMASTPVTGRTIRVAAGGDFQAALHRAHPGDAIVLQAGATYTGNFLLPAKGGSAEWITIRTSAIAGLPKEGMRVSPQHAKAMPKIVDPSGNGAISTALRAGYYRLIGLEVTVSAGVKNAWALVKLGSGGSDQDVPAVIAHHLILDRMYIHGDSAQNCFRCVALNSGRAAARTGTRIGRPWASPIMREAIIGWFRRASTAVLPPTARTWGWTSKR